MLKNGRVTAFLASTDLARSRAFFESVLGLEVVSIDGFALVLQSANGFIRVARVESVALAPYTVLGWEVSDIRSAVSQLVERGVTFNRYPDMGQDALGIWTAPSGSLIVWFQDPEGNVLSISEHPAES